MNNNTIANTPAGPLHIGDELPVLSMGPVTRQHLVEWCAAENDYYSLHYDERVAERMKLPGTPIQGTFKYALMGELLQGWSRGWGHLRRISARYTGLDLEGEVLAVRARLTRIEDDHLTFEVWAENLRGQRSLSGEACLQLNRGAA